MLAPSALHLSITTLQRKLMDSLRPWPMSHERSECKPDAKRKRDSAQPQETLQPSIGVDQEQGLHRRLTSWQLTMIAISGAIGVGLFLGSAVTIEIAGPGVLISYLFAALVAAIMAYALAEMAIVHPAAGSFGLYADQYLGGWAGFTVRLTYWFAQTIAIGAEVTAVGLYFGYWLPGVPQWVWVIASSALVLSVNAANVKMFGTVESWFAMIKVAAIVAFIVVGIALIIGIGQPAVGLGNLTAHGGFLPHGWTGVWLALTLVITSYMG